jgi:hypothetical protein
VPAGLTFAIWGIIYSWLLVFQGFLIASFFNKRLALKVNPIIEKVGYLFIFSCGLNMAWLLAWHYEFVSLSVLIMVSFLAVLLYLFLKIGVGKTKISHLEKWISHAPFSIYLGWICIATIANITALLIKIQWNSFGIEADAWAKIMIIVGTAITCFVLYKRSAIFYGLVVLWAFWGIHLKRVQIGDAPSLEINTIVYFCMGFLLLVIILRVKRWFDY